MEFSLKADQSESLGNDQPHGGLLTIQKIAKLPQMLMNVCLIL